MKNTHRAHRHAKQLAPNNRARLSSQETKDALLFWKGLTQGIEALHPKLGGPDRRPVGAERIPRIHSLWPWFKLSDTAAEDVLYDIPACRRFFDTSGPQERASDEADICKFHHLMGEHKLGDRPFRLVNECLQK